MTPDYTPPGARQDSREFQLSSPVASFVETVKWIFSEPKAFFGGISTTTPLANPIVFAASCIFLSTLAFLVVDVAVALLSGNPPLSGPLGRADGFSLFGWAREQGAVTRIAVVALGLVFSPVSGLISVFLYSGVAHLVVRVVMGRNAGFWATFRVVCYTSAVSLFRWIPFVGFFVMLYGLYLLFVGLRETHGSSPPRTISTEA